MGVGVWVRAKVRTRGEGDGEGEDEGPLAGHRCASNTSSDLGGCVLVRAERLRYGRCKRVELSMLWPWDYDLTRTSA